MHPSPRPAISVVMVVGTKTPAFPPLHFFFFAVDAAGQMIGNLAGRGSSLARLCDMEFQRYRFLPPDEAACF